MLQRGLEFAMENENKLICHICQKKFICVSTKNRHLRTMHNEKVEERKSQHIKCPICAEERKEPLANHDSLIQHLTKVHGLSIEQCNLNFRNMEEFKAWRTLEDTERDYAYTTSVNHHNGEKLIYYNCNRSNSKGFKSNCTKRAMKTGGSIRICGICPSRIRAKIYRNGTINVQFIKTHVGHEDELRTKRSSQKEQTLIVEQLQAGISNDRILDNARKIRDNQLDRLNLITRGDLRNLIRFNIDTKRDADDMVATALKVEEWNEEGKNQGFLFKKIGESHSDLRKENFAVGYMNSIIEKKLRDHKRIICIDGTHGTNRKEYELTTVLVKDDENMGFPVAFLVSNRRDQTIQEVFFKELKEKLGEDIDAEFLMSDDDPKYYNAWIKEMKTDKKPRRLLCTWHIIKNWNIQGKSKLKKQENRSQMKKEMRKILSQHVESAPVGSPG
jgi:hypothetical protein